MSSKGRLRKTLPKDINTLLEAAAESGDDAAVKSALERCDPNASDRYSKSTLLMNSRCSLGLARWAVERGADIHATDDRGYTALHKSARSRFHHRLTPDQLIELGADVHQASKEGLTPLHSAVDGKHLSAVKALLAAGARVQARSSGGLTPLEYGLSRISNIDLVAMVPVVQTLLDAGAEATQKARDSVLRAAENFEFHRAGFNKDLVDECSEAVAALCRLFAIEPPARRRMHDGTSPIVATADTAEKRYAELWELLVPSSGSCATVQGEVIRIAGRVHGEWQRNGGVNWDRDYASMAKAFCKHVGASRGLDSADLDACIEVVASLRQDPDSSERLLGWALEWVARNPNPIPLPPPDYSR